MSGFKTKVIHHAGGYMAMEWRGFLFWKEWIPISYTIHSTMAAAEKEVCERKMHAPYPSKSCAV